MQKITKKAYAKINLTLEILEKRSDGYHNIRSIMQKISLCDVLTFEFFDEERISLECNKNVCDMRDNLAYKAAEKYLALYKEKSNKSFGVHIYIEKNIPDKAGLAGGSADCACVLDCLYEKYGVLDYSDVEEIAASLGSDINFCLDKYRCALCTDRGIKLEKCTPFEWENVLVCVPDLGMKTSDIYNAFDASPILFEDNPSCVVKDALAFKDTKTVFSHIVNSFESICEKECADISHIKSIMTSHGSNASSMSGSGSSVFGFFNDAQSLNACKAELTKKYKKCFECRTVTE
ncbi:MAG: 4-(cytidine 5'-diphospho)-2-C-methyl-D-erythritol kinase [Ruminococcaceae bacterium]|nr:4-(cytidine 5'-diphospho)-2-C-methyl-D-erythritol kinase [Oscillospiraceae bacterium]